MTDISATETSNERPTWVRRVIFCVVCAIVMGMLLLGARSGLSVLKNADAKDCYYNLLIDGFRAGQLNLKRAAPPGLARLVNPYDPAENAPFLQDVGDMSYYKGKLYLYYGVGPALALYWPCVALTGEYLQDAWAALIFCCVGFLAGAALLYSIWRRYFSGIQEWVAMAGIFIFGLMIAAHEWQWIGIRIYEVTESGGFAFAMLSVASTWMALHQRNHRRVWLLLASLAYGLAIASRPSLLFGAIILLVPIVQEWRESGRSPRAAVFLLTAAVGPILLIGVGLMTYNVMRFGNPLEFGCRYEVTGLAPADTDLGQFSPSYFWFNFRYYFWEPVQWISHLPWLTPVTPWKTSSGHFGPGQYYGGLLILYPAVWLALAALSAWRARPHRPFRCFVAALLLLFITCALPICLFNIANERYELDFLPALALLAVIGIFAVESPDARSGAWRDVARWAWRVLAGCMMVIGAAAGLDSYATGNYFAGNVLLNRGLPDEAIEHYQRTLEINARYAGAIDGLGNAFLLKGRGADALIQYKKALEVEPGLVESRFDLAHCYYTMGQVAEAISQDEAALKSAPNYVKARNDLASCYLRQGRLSDALAQLDKTVTIAPDFADARNNLGYCLLLMGRTSEAIFQFQQAVSLDPNSANFLCGLGNALLKGGLPNEAVAEYQKAVELAPAVAGVHYQLGSGLLQIGKVDAAIGQFQRAVELKPDSAAFHRGLAGALERKGLPAAAAIQYQKAIELEPTLVNRPRRQSKSPAITPGMPSLTE